MAGALRAGAVYFAIAFAVAFALGTMRVLFVAPRLGEMGAVLLEVPVMIAMSWVVCAFVVRRMTVPAATSARLAMGLSAFALLMLAEAALAVFAFGRTFAAYLDSYRSAHAQVGLAAQILFAFLPLIQTWRPARP